MGYYIKLLSAKFEIPSDKADRAYNELASFHGGIVISSAGSKDLDLGKIFADLAWPLERTKTGWVMVDGDDCKHGWEDALFEKAAPFVRDGSVIRGRGEDGEIFMWRFAGGRLRRASVLRMTTTPPMGTTSRACG
jgi:hypothetical protein